MKRRWAMVMMANLCGIDLDLIHLLLRLLDQLVGWTWT
jgi:hypothetical protein